MAESPEESRLRAVEITNAGLVEKASHMEKWQADQDDAIGKLTQALDRKIEGVNGKIDRIQWGLLTIMAVALLNLIISLAKGVHP